MQPMTPRQRVEAVLRGENLDRLPVDMWFTEEVYADLARLAGTDDDVAIWERLGIDRIQWFGAEYAGPMRTDIPDGGATTPFGAVLKPCKSGAATYLEYTDHPLAAMEEVDELARYPWWPDPQLWDIDKMATMINRWSTRHAVFGPWVSIFEIYCGMRGLELAMIDLLDNPDFVVAACDRIEHVQTVMMEALLERTKGQLNGVFISDDMGSQNGLMISLAAWEEFVGPRLRRWCDLAHRHGVKVLYHSDGAIRPLIPKLIEAGVDILNPIQHRCPGMELDGLHRDFGDHLIFHGGVDTQQILPFGSPDDVRDETRRCIEALAPDGKGYLPASCHNIQAGTPIENIMAMVETVRTSMVGSC